MGGDLVRVSSWGDWEVVHCSSKYKHGTEVTFVDPTSPGVGQR